MIGRVWWDIIPLSYRKSRTRKYSKQNLPCSLPRCKSRFSIDAFRICICLWAAFALLSSFESCWRSRAARSNLWARKSTLWHCSSAKLCFFSDLIWLDSRWWLSTDKSGNLHSVFWECAVCPNLIWHSRNPQSRIRTKSHLQFRRRQNKAFNDFMFSFIFLRQILWWILSENI